jgi:hypothetical protein
MKFQVKLNNNQFMGKFGFLNPARGLFQDKI